MERGSFNGVHGVGRGSLEEGEAGEEGLLHRSLPCTPSTGGHGGQKGPFIEPFNALGEGSFHLSMQDLVPAATGTSSAHWHQHPGWSLRNFSFRSLS